MKFYFLSTLTVLLFSPQGFANGEEVSQVPLEITCSFTQKLDSEAAKIVNKNSLEEIESQWADVLNDQDQKALDITVTKPNCYIQYSPDPIIAFPSIFGGIIGNPDAKTCLSKQVVVEIDGRPGCLRPALNRLGYLASIGVRSCRVELEKGKVQEVAITAEVTQEQCDIYSKEQQDLASGNLPKKKRSLSDFFRTF